MGHRKSGGIRSQQPERRATIKTIADHLNLSIATVSRSLRDGTSVSPDTLQRVRDAADQFGYVRNLDGVRLRTGKSLVVFALLGTSPDEEMGDSGSVGLLYGIHKRFVDTDYSVRAAPHLIGTDALDLLEELASSRSADGVILDHTEPQDIRVRFLLEHNIPFVTFGRTELYTRHAYFDVDNEYSAYSLTDYLIKKGHGRIGLLDPDLGYTFAHQRLMGYKRALLEHGFRYDEGLIRRFMPDAEQARKATADLLARAGADAFVCVNEIVMLGALAAIGDAGLVAGRDVGLGARTGTNITNYLPAKIATSHYSRHKAGWKLADLLLQHMNNRPVASLELVEQPELRGY